MSTPVATPVDPIPRTPGLLGRAIRGGALLMAARTVVQPFFWLITIFVARLLSEDDYGLMTMGTIFIGFADLFAEAGVGRALIQKADLQPIDTARAFTFSLLLSLVLYVVLCTIAWPAQLVLAMPGLAGMMPVLGLFLLLVPFRAVAMALLDRDLRMGQQAAGHLVCAVLHSIVVLGLALGGAGYWTLVLGAVAGRFFETLSLLYFARWRPALAWPWPGRGSDTDASARQLLHFGIHLSLVSLLWYIYSNADFAILGVMLGKGPLGFYALAFQLISLPVQKITSNVNQVAYPVFCRLQDNQPKLRELYLRLTVLIGLVGVPAMVGMALVADDAFKVVLSEKWLPAVLPFKLLSLVGLVMVYSSSLPPLINSLGRPDLLVRYLAACVIVLPLGFFLGAWWLGVTGVCLAWLVLFPLLFAGLVHWTRSLTGIGLGDFLRAQLPLFVAVALMASFVGLVQYGLASLPQTWIRLVASIATGALCYAGAILVLARKTVLADLRILLAEVRR